MLGLLLGVLCYHQPQHVLSWQAVAELSWHAAAGGGQLGIALADVEVLELEDASETEDTQLLPALLLALTRVLAAVAAASPGCEALLQPVWELLQEQLTQLVIRCGGSGSSTGSTMTPVEVVEGTAALQALPGVLDTCVAAGLVSQAAALKAVAGLATLASAGQKTGGPALDGRLVGCAAEALCSVCRRLLLQNVDLAAALGCERDQADSSSGSSSATAVLAALAARLQQLLQQPHKGPNSSALRSSALLAAAGLLGAQLPSSSSPQQEGPNLLSDPGSLAAAKQALKQLEAAAMVVGGDTRSAEVAAWALAAASYSCALHQPAAGTDAAAGGAAASGGAGSTASSAAALKPLSAYPADGAMRPLAEVVLAAAPGTGMSAGALAACIR